MTEYLAKKFANWAINESIIKEADKELYVYSYQISMEIIFSWSFMLILALIVKSFFGFIMFSLFFIPLRTHIGGYHADGFLVCFLFSNISFLAICLINIYWSIYLSSTTYIFIVAFCAFLLVFLKPGNDPKKPYTKEESIYHLRKARIIIVIQIILLIALSFTAWGVKWMMFPIGSFVILSVLHILGRIKFKQT